VSTCERLGRDAKILTPHAMDQTFRTLNSSPLSEFVDQNVEDFITSQRHLHVRLDSVAQTIFDENSEAMRLSKLGTPAWGEFSTAVRTFSDDSAVLRLLRGGKGATPPFGQPC
jgi:hypothetical protein